MTESLMMGIVIFSLLVTAGALAVCFVVVRRQGKAGFDESFLRYLSTKEDVRTLHEDNERARMSAERQGRDGREEVSQRLDLFSQGVAKNFISFGESQARQLDAMVQKIDGMSEKNAEKLESIRVTLDGKMKELQESNSTKLDEMRGVVNDKLQRTLEERLGASFKQVSDQLEKVYTNLGEIRTLSKDMGVIKNIFKNVKTRGTWGEVQLGALLEQMLTPEQFAANIKLRAGSDDNVEFAVKLPGPDEKSVVWLPIDSKFPMEDYDRMMEAVEKGDADAMTAASKALESRVVSQARTIRDKYIAPPMTTDFALLFVPVESLFAEILRRPGLAERLQQEFRVTVAGPTTLAALLNSLRMGFRTLAIQKSSGEVWKLLGAVKKQFTTFGENLDSVQKHLDRAAKSVSDASQKAGIISRRLDKVQELPQHEAERLLPLGTGSETEGHDEMLTQEVG